MLQQPLGVLDRLKNAVHMDHDAAPGRRHLAVRPDGAGKDVGPLLRNWRGTSISVQAYISVQASCTGGGEEAPG